MDSVKYVTRHNRINIGKKINKNKNANIKSKMCNKIKCVGQYTVDLINNNLSRDV